MKIVLINIFIGQPPFYFQYFLETAKRNKEVDFLLLSSEFQDHHDNNIIYRNISLEELSSRIREKVGVQLQYDSLNKLCDFKPTFGLLFEDYIKSYDYWGHIDIDIILGNTHAVLGEQFRKGYDIITTRGNNWISGAFTCYKNQDYVNNLFKISPTHKNVLGNKKQLLFDESGYRWDGDLHTFEYLEENKLTISMFDIIGLEEKRNNLKVFRENLICEYHRNKGYEFKLSSKNGRLFENGRERLLFHFIFVKNDPFFIWPINLPDSFDIVNMGIFDTKSSLQKRNINFFGNYLKRYPNYFFSRVNRKLKSLARKK